MVTTTIQQAVAKRGGRRYKPATFKLTNKKSLS